MVSKKKTSVTIFDVARESGVSYSTVSRVVNGYEFVKEATRSRVLEAANKLGYVVNMQARSLAGGRSHVIGLLVPTIDNGYVSEIARGADEELSKFDYELMLYTTHRRNIDESAYARLIANGLSDGLLLMSPLNAKEYALTLHEQGYPYVLIDQDDVTESNSLVDVTNWQGGYDATRYLIELGHRRIATITGNMALSAAVKRLDGYRTALAEAHIPYRPDYVLHGDFWIESGSQSAERLLSLDEPPTAIFVQNDLMAFGAMDAAVKRGLTIPNDLSVIGFDDIQQASMTFPRLTTIQQPLSQLGKVAVQLLIEQIENPESPPKHITLETRLMIRQTCQAPK